MVDLYAIGFDPVSRLRDQPSWLPDANAPEVVEKVVRERVRPPGAGLVRRLVTWALLRGRSDLEVVDEYRARLARLHPKALKDSRQEATLAPGSALR